MQISSKKLLFINIVVYGLFLLPLIRLNLFNENYSTLSLDTRGYFYLLFLGIITGFVMSYETLNINDRKYAYLMFFSLLLGTVVPHHVPYDLQGNIHLFLSYAGFAGMMTVTYLNILGSSNEYLMNMYFLLLIELGFIYMQYGMVNTLMEIIIMSFNLFINFLLYKKKCG